MAIILGSCNRDAGRQKAQQEGLERELSQGESSTIDPYKEERKLSAAESSASEQDQVDSVAEEAEENSPSQAPPAASTAPEDEPGEPEVLAELSLPETREESAQAPLLPLREEPVAQSPDMPSADVIEQGLSLLEESQVEEHLLKLINAERESMGRGSLGMQEEMRLAARIRGAEVIGVLSHTRPNGSAYNTAFDEAGFAYAGKYHGENILYLQAPKDRFDSKSLAQRIFDELSASSGHYQNMTRDAFLQAGMGVHIQYDGEMMEVGCAQLFAGL